MTQTRHALLLTAGLGTRLRPLTLVRAKPALPVGGIPLVRRIVAWLAEAGVTQVVMNLHHLPETIAAVVGDGSDLGVHVRYSWEQPAILGSAGGPRQALDILGARRFLLINGDTLTDAALEPLIDAHASSGALVTLAVVPNTRPDHYSGLRVDAGGAVLGVEPRGSSRPSFHFFGVQVAEAEAFAGISEGRAANSIGDVYDALIAARPGCIRAHLCEARYWDIGTVADYWNTSRDFQTFDGEAPPARLRRGTAVEVADSILWDDVVLGDGSSVRHCIVTDGVHVEAGARYSNAILMRAPDGRTVQTPLTPEKA